MADTKISALTELATTPTSGDLTVIIDDPGGTPVSKKITVDNLVAFQDARTATFTNKTLGASTLSGTMSAADNIIDQPKLQDYSETVNARGSISGAQTIDLELGNVVTATITGATTFTFSNPPASGSAGSFTLIVTNPSTNITWPAAVDWAGGSAPTLTGTGVDILTFLTTDGGTTWYGFVAGIAMA